MGHPMYKLGFLYGLPGGVSVERCYGYGAVMSFPMDSTMEGEMTEIIFLKQRASNWLRHGAPGGYCQMWATRPRNVGLQT
jgi:hypothetical protein